ncbi:MAG: hypothetical protein ACMUIP_11740 [bacterium]
MTKNFCVFTDARYRENEIFGNHDQSETKEEQWHITGGFSFSLMHDLTLSLNGLHSERESNDPSAVFRNNQGTIRLVWIWQWLTLTLDNTYTETDEVNNNRISIRIASAYPLSF